MTVLLDRIRSERNEWWTSKEKREQRNRLQKNEEKEKLSALHKINWDMAERVEGMQAKFGQFVRWSVGVDGGLQRLEEEIEKLSVEREKKGKEEE